MIPQKVLSRKDEITADFLNLVNKHMDDVLHNRVDQMFHTKNFADLLFIHPRHLTNTIKLTTGKSPCDHLEERIFAESVQLLENTDLSIAAIGSRFTYYEPTNFIKFFKSMSGTTPLQYRKKFQASLPVS